MQPSQFIQAQLCCDGPSAKPHFFLLHQQREEIEAELGEQLEWRELPEKKQSYITLRLDDADVMNREDWPRQHQWLVEKLEAMHKVFAERVRALNADGFVPSEDE